MMKSLNVCELVIVNVSACFCDEYRDPGFPCYESCNHGVATSLELGSGVPF